MAEVIPRICVMKSNYTGKYFRYVQEEKQRRYIRCDGDDIFDPKAKFMVERSKVDKRRYVHIRSCYNNKYWRRCSEEEGFIVAAADAANEDRDKWSCTLFEPIAEDDNVFRFLHVQSYHSHVRCLKSDDEYQNCLMFNSKYEQEGGVNRFKVTDWESLVILPKHVAFKGDNGKYLRYRGEGDDHLEFGANDIGHNRVGEQIFTNPDGSISVKHDSNGKFWRASPNWIYPDTSNISNSDLATSFWPVKLQGNGIALRSKVNDRFLRRTDYGGTTDCLAAASWATTIDKQSHLVLEELVEVREVYDVKYRLDDARVYGESILTLARSCVSNMTQQTEELEVTMSYTEAWKYEWSNSTSKLTSFGMKFSAGIPMILDASIEVKGSKEGEYEWGITVDGSRTLTKRIPVSVPPMTKKTVSLVATLGSCDVPFSYTQQDTLTNGNVEILPKHDGIYSGANCFKFRTQVTEEKI